MLKSITILLAVLASVLGSIGALYLKKASEKFKIRFSSVLDANLLAGLFFYFASAAVVILLLKFNEMSFVYPLTALTYFFVAVISWKFLNEKINKYKLASIFFIVLGVVLVAMG